MASAKVVTATKLSNFVHLPPLPSIKDLLKLYKLRAIKQLSQNFLLNERITDRIVKRAGRIRGAEVCEVGPGPGSITRSIIKKCPEKVLLIEKDKRFIPTLELLAEASPCEIQLLIGDVMTLNMEKLFKEDKRRDWFDDLPDIRIIGNLPFNISTPLIIKWIKAISCRENAWKYGRVPLTLTFQKEFGDRCVAPISVPDRCRLSVMCQNWCHVHSDLVLPGRVFTPKPDVDVSVVQFTPMKYPIIPLPFEFVEKVARCLFAHKRRFVTKGIGNLFPEAVRGENTERVVKLAEIDPAMRPITLTVPEIGRICYAYKEICDENPSLYKFNHRQPKRDNKIFDEGSDSPHDLYGLSDEEEAENNANENKIIRDGEPYREL